MDAIPLLDPTVPGLHDARPAGVFPFLLEGETVWVHGTASRPGLHVGHGTRRLATIRGDGEGTAANLVHYPGMSRRDFASPRGGIVETVLATPTLPLAVVQWDGGAGGGPEVVEVVLHDADGARTTDAHGVTVDAFGKVDGTVSTKVPDSVGMELSLAPAAARVELDAVDGAVCARFTPEPGEHVTLLVGLRIGGKAAPLGAARHARSHAVRATSEPPDGLRLRTGVSEVDDAVAWLRVRLAGEARRLGSESSQESALSVGLAATAVGDRDVSAAVLASMVEGTAHHALVAARHAAVFGETSAARTCARRWVDPSAPPIPSSSLVALAATELADALHLSGDPATVAGLRALSTRRLAGGPSEGGGSLPTSGPSLPMAGRSLPIAGRPLPMAGASGSPKRGVDPSGDPTAADTTRLERLLAGDLDPAVRDPDAAWVGWRNQLVDGSGRVVTLWNDDPPWIAEAPSLAVDLLTTLASGILGIRADSAAGRIRLAPRLPVHLTRFEAMGITLGSSAIALRYEATRGGVRFEIEPTVASVPPLLVFEPLVSGNVTEVRVDGVPAELDVESVGRRTKVPVQLPLDATRVVELTLTTE